MKEHFQEIERFACPGNLELVSHRGNSVYYHKNSDSFLRVTDLHFGTVLQLIAELDLLHHLESLGLRLGKPVPLKTGKILYETEDSQFALSLFSRIYSKEVPRASFLKKPSFISRWGEEQARIHMASKSYQEPSGNRRFSYEGEGLILDMWDLILQWDLASRELAKITMTE